MDDVVIVGSGVAGHSAAMELRRCAPGRQIVMVGAEAGPPYDRPPLSKEFLKAEQPTRPTLGSSDAYGKDIRLLDGLSAVSIDRVGQSIALSDGSKLGYQQLLLATGSRLRRLPLGEVDLGRIHYLRTIEDAHRLRSALQQGSRVAIIGGGFIGLEVAAAASMRGCAVTVFEVEASLLSRTGTPTLGRYVERMHRDRGVTFVMGARVEQVVGTPGGLSLRWPGGQVEADAVVVGVGVLPNLELAAEAGLMVDDGIHVDSSCRTSDPAIFAAGEVTNYPLSRLGIRLRTESWSAASSQGVVAARVMSGLAASYDELPWFWSDQYDVNIQCIGMPKAAKRYLQIGDPRLDRWLRIGVDDGDRLVGAEAVNMGREVSALRRADRSGQPIPAALIDQSDDRRARPAEQMAEASTTTSSTSR